uniref:Uncharacterized protein LOC108052151 n=1 Tax=Drosophila rhopaloa TaxID=1041015 RepID=A0A6P4FJC9_DRORH
MGVSQYGWVFLAFAIIRLAIDVVGDVSSYYTEYSSSSMKAVAAINNIHVFGESHFMRVRTYIYDDRSHFDLNVQMVHELGSNHLIMNIKVRVKPDGTNAFVELFELRRINFCEFLKEYNSNPVIRFMFKKNLRLSDLIECPIRVGNYSLLHADVAGNMHTEGIQNGTYKFFAEIVEEMGEIAKVFALQVTSKVNIVAKDSICEAHKKVIVCV